MDFMQDRTEEELIAELNRYREFSAMVIDVLKVVGNLPTTNAEQAIRFETRVEALRDYAVRNGIWVEKKQNGQ
jgi:hypothetical protein